MKIGKRTTKIMKEKMLAIIQDRESGMKFKDIATKHWMKKDYACTLYHKGLFLKKIGRLEP
jgi:hypothetical protein